MLGNRWLILMVILITTGFSKVCYAGLLYDNKMSIEYISFPYENDRTDKTRALIRAPDLEPGVLYSIDVLTGIENIDSNHLSVSTVVFPGKDGILHNHISGNLFAGIGV